MQVSLARKLIFGALFCALLTGCAVKNTERSSMEPRNFPAASPATRTDVPPAWSTDVPHPAYQIQSE